MKRLFSTRVSENTFSLAMLVLRLGAGLLMLQHGFQKLSNYAHMSQVFKDPTGILSNSLALALTVFAEFFCAAFIVLGLFTRLAAIPLVISCAVAFFIAHKGVYAPGPGSGELALFFLIGFVTVLLAGPGKFSLDRLIAK